MISSALTGANCPGDIDPSCKSSKVISGVQWLIIVISGIVILFGIAWEVPNQRRMEVLLGGAALTERQKELLVSLREDYLRNATATGDELARMHVSGEQLNLKEFALPQLRGDGPVIYSEADRLNAFRGFVLRTAAMDEGKVYQALARMDPAHFDFDPKFYTYGGAYIYSMGAILLLAKTVGLIDASANMRYYVDHPASIGHLYIVGRAVNIVLLCATLFLLGILGNFLGGRRAGTLAMLIYALSGLPLSLALVSKPHIFVAFFIFLSITFAVLHARNRSWFTALASGVCMGMAAGATLPAAAAFVAPLVLLWDGRNRRDSLVKIAGTAAVAALTWLGTNPYAILSWDKYSLNLLVLMSPQGWGYSAFSPWKLVHYAREIFGQYYCLFAAPFAIVGFIAAFRSDNPVARRIAVGSILMLLIVGMAPLEARHVTFIGPVLCLFAGWGLSIAVERLFPGRIIVQRAAVAAIVAPGALLASLFISYVIWDEAWYQPAVQWTKDAHIGPETSIATFGTPDPNFTPPFPFINAKLMNLYKLADEVTAPEYVVLGNSPAFNDRALWAEHPLRDRYELVRALGYRPSYDWLPQWRVRDEARVTAWIYKRKDL